MNISSYGRTMSVSTSCFNLRAHAGSSHALSQICGTTSTIRRLRSFASIFIISALISSKPMSNSLLERTLLSPPPKSGPAVTPRSNVFACVTPRRHAGRLDRKIKSLGALHSANALKAPCLHQADTGGRGASCSLDLFVDIEIPSRTRLVRVIPGSG